MYKLAAALTVLAAPAMADGLDITVAGQANGTIHIDLFEDTAPLHVAQIEAIATEGGYDGVVFHRVIEGFMAQTGDVEFGKVDGDTARAGMGGSELPDIKAEFSNELSFDRGVVGMARSQSPDWRTANSLSCSRPARFWTANTPSSAKSPKVWMWSIRSSWVTARTGPSQARRT